MSNQNIVDRIREGDQAVLEEVYRTYREPFAAWLQKQYRCSSDEAMEFYQTSILIFYDNIKRGKLEQLSTSVKTYLFAIGKNKWREYNRYKQKNHNTESFDHMEMMEPLHEDNSHQVVTSLKKALIKLGDPCRKLLEAFYFDRLKLDQIVDEMGYKNKDTAKNIKYKCIQRLKRMMGAA